MIVCSLAHNRIGNTLVSKAKKEHYYYVIVCLERLIALPERENRIGNMANLLFIHTKNDVFFFNRLLGFYKGILPPILAETPKRAVKVKN